MRIKPRTSIRAVVGAVTAALLLSGCGDGTGSEGGPGDRDTVSMALPVGSTPNWILPIGSPDTMATYNSAIKATLYPALFEYDGQSGKMEWDKKASAAKSYEFSPNRTSVTITLGDLTWSDGTPLTTRDVEFWYNLTKFNAEKTGGYSKGMMPDNITEFQTLNSKQFTLHLDKVYNEDFFVATQLTLIRPMPQHVWDKTSDGGAVSDLDRTQDGAGNVLTYLFGQAEKVSNYQDNPLFKTVAGPYQLKSWSDSGSVTLTANPRYTGPDRPSIKNVKLQPYTSVDAEANTVRSGGVDYGYISASQTENKDQFDEFGYTIKPWDGWSVTYMSYNFKADNGAGDLFKQLYLRQALQHSVDQPNISTVVWHDAATPGYGPIPQHPESKFLSPVQAGNPYPYDLDAAQNLLTDHGWSRGSQGVLECTSPGSGPHQCGAGIRAGKKLELTFTVQNGSQETDNMFSAIKSDLDRIGVKVNIDAKPLNNVLTEAQSCKQGTSCDWQLTFYGAAGSWYFSGYPSGERLFAKDTKWNAGQYDSPEAEELINQMVLSSDPSISQKYSAYLARDLPVLWLPNPVYQVSAVKKHLNVGHQDPGGNFYPQRWKWE